MSWEDELRDSDGRWVRIATVVHSGSKMTRSISPMPESMAHLSDSEREHIARNYELHIDNSTSINRAISNLGVNVANVGYGKITGLHHENKIIVTRKGLSNGDLIHEIGHSIDRRDRHTVSTSEFGLGINAAISRELRSAGNVSPHFDTKQAAGSATRERFAEIFSQYRRGIRRYKLGSNLSPELSARITKYLDGKLA